MTTKEGRSIRNRHTLIIATGLGIALILFTACSTLVLRHPLRIGHDQAQYVLIGKAMLEGARLYIDIDDNNPPAICFINMVPAFFSNLLNEPAPMVFSFFTIGLGCYCFGMSLYLYWQARPILNNPGIVAFMVCVPVWILLDLLEVGAWVYQFGQREQLCMLTFLPMFMLSFLRAEGVSLPKPWMTFLIGLLAGFGIVIKPPIFIFLLLSLGLHRSKSIKALIFRPELFGMVTAVLLYAVAILRLPEESRKLYFEMIVPILLIGYTFFDRSLICILNYYGTDSQYIFWWSLLAGGLAIYLRSVNNFVGPACVLMFCGYFMYLLQGKGFPLHIMPLWIATASICSLEAVTLIALAFNQIRAFWRGTRNFQPSFWESSAGEETRLGTRTGFGIGRPRRIGKGKSRVGPSRFPTLHVIFFLFDHSLRKALQRFATFKLFLALLILSFRQGVANRIAQLRDLPFTIKNSLLYLSRRPSFTRPSTRQSTTKNRSYKRRAAIRSNLVLNMFRDFKLFQIEFSHFQYHLKIFPRTRVNLLFFAIAIVPFLWWTNAILEKDFRDGYGELRFSLSRIGYGGLCSKYDIPLIGEEILKYTEMGEPVAVLCRSTEPGAVAILQLRRKPALAHLEVGRLCCLMHVEGVAPKGWAERFQAYRQKYCNELISDILTQKPKVVFIQMWQTTEFLEAVDFSKRAMKDYEKIGEFSDFIGYRLKGTKPKDIGPYYVPAMNVLDELK